MTRATRLGLGVAVVVLLLTAVAAVVLYRDATAVEPMLRDVQVQLEMTQAAVEDGDEAAARATLARAEDSIARARGRTDGPLWSLAGAVPRYGASVRAVRGGIDLAEATAELAGAALDTAVVLLDEGADAFVGPDGRILTDGLTAVADDLDELPLAPVVAARDRLAALPTAGLVGPTRAARDDAVARADAVVRQVERARLGVRTFSGFLGAGGTRTYLVGVQNPGELRGTGGLLSVLVEMTLDDGAIAVRPAGGRDLVDDRITSGGQETVGFDLDPVERPREFAERYDSNAGGAIIQSVNLDPDLPTVAPVLLELYEARTGASADGVVLVDPFVLAALLDVTGGPLPLPDAALAAAPGLPPALTSANAAETVLIDLYDELGGDSPLRDDLDDALALAVLDRLRSGDWEPTALARALADEAAARRLQLFSTDAAEQDGLLGLGIAGAMTEPASGTDVLAVTGINAGPDKSDVHVAHRLTADIRLRARPGAGVRQVLRDATVTVAVDNPLRPDDHDDYITGTNEPAPVGTGSPRVRDAMNRTWFTIWSPASTRLTSLRDGVQGDVLRTGTIHGHTAIDHFLETPSASTAAWSAPYTGPFELREIGGRYRYELVLWRQAKGIPDAWDLRVTPPFGLVVDEVTVTGGGPPTTGLGPADPEPVRAVVQPDGAAKLTGGVTRDTVLHVWLVPD